MALDFLFKRAGFVIVYELCERWLVEIHKNVRKFRVQREPARKVLAVDFAKRLYVCIPVLSADFAVLIAMPMVESRLFRGVSSLGISPFFLMRDRPRFGRAVMSIRAIPPGQGKAPAIATGGGDMPGLPTFGTATPKPRHEPSRITVCFCLQLGREADVGRADHAALLLLRLHVI
jgi:hypothetical protein